MKKLMGVVILCVVLVLLLVVSGHAQRLGPYPIGCVTDLTGRMSEMGTANKRGMDIAIEAINAAVGVNGRLFKAIVYDSESDPPKSVLHTKRLIEVDKAIILTFLQPFRGNDGFHPHC